MLEKRKTVRVAPIPSEPVEVQIIGEDFVDVHHAQDIGRDGMCIEVQHGFSQCDINSELDLIVTLPGGDPFKARGTLRQKKAKKTAGGFFGIELTAIAKRNREAIEGYVEDLLFNNSALAV